MTTVDLRVGKHGEVIVRDASGKIISRSGPGRRLGRARGGPSGAIPPGGVPDDTSARQAALARLAAQRAARELAARLAREKAQRERQARIRSLVELSERKRSIGQSVSEGEELAIKRFRAGEDLTSLNLTSLSSGLKKSLRRQLGEEAIKTPAKELGALRKFEKAGGMIELKDKAAKVISVKIPPRPPRVVKAFISPPLIKKFKTRIANIGSRVSREGVQIGKNAIEIKRDIDAKVSKELKKLGVTDKNIKKFSGTITASDVIKFQNPKFITDRLEKLGILKKIREIEVEIKTGVIKEVRDKPTEVAISFGVGKALPSGLRFLRGTKIVKRISKITPAKLKKIGKEAISPALVAAYVAESGLEVGLAPRGEKIQAIGRKIPEIVPFQLGVKSGVRGVLRKEMQEEIKKAIAKLPKRKQNVFKELMKKSNLLEKAKTKVRDVDLKRLKRIPDKAKSTIIKFLKEKDVIVGGSLGQQTGVKVKRTLAQSDLDLYTEKNPIGAARDLVRRLQKLGIKRVGRVDGKVTISGKKAAEFHNIDRLIANIESVTPTWKNPKSFIIRTKGGIRVPKLTVQLKRKLVGGFTDPMRSKDLKDSKDIMEQLFKRVELQARNKFLFREKNIKALEKIFKVKISRKVPVIAKKPKIKKLPTKRLKKPKILVRKPSKIPAKVGEGVRGIKTAKKIKKPSVISKKKIKIKKPSQLPIKKPSQIQIRRIRVSQFPKRPIGRPSQPPRRPPRPPRRPPPTTRVPPPIIPRRPTPPSQPPRRPPRRPPPTTRVPPPTGKPPKRPPRRPPTKPLLISRKKRKIKEPKAKQGFDVLGKSGKKFFKLSKKPLSLKDAKDRGSFAVDKTTSRTFKIVPAGRVRKSLGSISKKERGHYQRNKQKLRDFRIVKGKRRPLKNKFIERVTHAIDTKTESSQLSIAKLRKQQFGFGKPVKRKKVVRSQLIKRPKPLQRNSSGQFVKRRR